MKYRHGDILSVPTNKKIKAKKQEETTLALGEFTGHSHRLLGDVTAIAVIDDVEYYKVNAPADLIHQEHKKLRIKPATYKIVREREFDYFGEEVKQVWD